MFDLTLEIEKWIWTEVDYEIMGWNCAFVHGFRRTEDLEFDIDYIFKWNDPVAYSGFTFYVSPFTLVFHSYKQLDYPNNATIEGGDISHVHRLDGNEWQIDFSPGQWFCETGEQRYFGFNMRFESEGFTQYVRKKPGHEFDAFIKEQHRGGLSFSRVTGESAQYDLDREFVLRKQKEFDDYRKYLELMNLKIEYERLVGVMSKGNNSKERYKSKRKLKQEIKTLRGQLEGTIFEGRAYRAAEIIYLTL